MALNGKVLITRLYNQVEVRRTESKGQGKRLRLGKN